MDERNIEHRLTENEQRAKSNSHRLDKLEPVVQEIHTLSMTIVEMVQELKHTNETINDLDIKVDRMESRVDEMEKEPVKSLRDNKKVIVDKILGVVIEFLIVGLIWAAVQAF